MKTIKIGKENAYYQEIVALKENRSKRNQLKKFFVEGTQNIKDAIQNKWKINCFIYSNYNKLSDWAKSVLNKAEINIDLDEKLMKNLSNKENTSELLAIIDFKEMKIQLNNMPLIVLLDRPAKKGNFGSIIRSCDALNVDCIYFTGHAVDIYDSNVITSSMGSFFKMPFQYLTSNQEVLILINELKTKFKNFQVVGTSLEATTLIQNFDFTKPTMLLVGNETTGLSQFYHENADALVKINMKKGIDSLNVASATTVCLYEINRQRVI